MNSYTTGQATEHATQGCQMGQATRGGHATTPRLTSRTCPGAAACPRVSGEPDSRPRCRRASAPPPSPTAIATSRAGSPGGCRMKPTTSPNPRRLAPRCRRRHGRSCAWSLRTTKLNQHGYGPTEYCWCNPPVKCKPQVCFYDPVARSVTVGTNPTFRSVAGDGSYDRVVGSSQCNVRY